MATVVHAGPNAPTEPPPVIVGPLSCQVENAPAVFWNRMSELLSALKSLVTCVRMKFCVPDWPNGEISAVPATVPSLDHSAKRPAESVPENNSFVPTT